MDTLKRGTLSSTSVLRPNQAGNSLIQDMAVPLWNQVAWISVMALSLISFVALGKSHSHPGHPLLLCRMRTTKIPPL